MITRDKKIVNTKDALPPARAIKEPVEVIATRDGFYDGRRVRAGETFTADGLRLGKWMQPVNPEYTAPVEDNSTENTDEDDGESLA